MDNNNDRKKEVTARTLTLRDKMNELVELMPEGGSCLLITIWDKPSCPDQSELVAKILAKTPDDLVDLLFGIRSLLRQNYGVDLSMRPLLPNEDPNEGISEQITFAGRQPEIGH